MNESLSSTNLHSGSSARSSYIFRNCLYQSLFMPRSGPHLSMNYTILSVLLNGTLTGLHHSCARHLRSIMSHFILSGSDSNFLQVYLRLSSLLMYCYLYIWAFSFPIHSFLEMLFKKKGKDDIEFISKVPSNSKDLFGNTLKLGEDWTWPSFGWFFCLTKNLAIVGPVFLSQKRPPKLILLWTSGELVHNWTGSH